MRNTLADLNNILFAELESLQDEELSDEEMERRLKRADKVGAIADKIIANASLEFKVIAHMNEYGYGTHRDECLVPVPTMLLPDGK